jgi:predicted CopG family antitoxin
VHDKCMAVKTITIDLEAYEALARRKQPGQSFSDVIKRHFASGSTGRDLLEAVRRFPLAEDTLDAVEAQLRARRRGRSRIPKW